MTDQAINPAAVARIRKLLSLSRDGAASENEQEIAAAHAQRLMIEHNVSVAQAEAAQDVSKIARRQKDTHVGHAMYEWQRDLMAATATTCFVTVISTSVQAAGSYSTGKHRIKSYDLVGREENVVGCRILFDYLRATTERLSREFAGGNSQALGNAAHSFKKGCAERLISRLLQRHREALAEQRAKTEEARAASGGTAVAVFLEDFAEAAECANDDFRLGLPPGTTARKRYVSTQLGKAYNAVAKALADEAYATVDDRTQLDQRASEVLAETLAHAGLDPEETVRAKAYAGWAVSAHIDAVKESKSPSKKRRAASRSRSWGRVKKDTTNYSAFRAGDAAGKTVSLDRQAGHAPLKQIG